MKRKTIEHYEIIRRLGAGGSGVVYLANDTLLQRPVVLKILRTGLLSAQQLRTTVLREARLASAIEHPNVCAIYEVGEAGDEGYIVMQYVPGQSLDQLIARGPATPQLVLSVGIQIADGLQAAHSLGIFHRDLKPQNVMLTDGGLVKILDFGLARRLQPEDANFDPVEARACQRCLRRRDIHRARRHHPLHGAGAVCHRPVERAVRRVGARRHSLRACQRPPSVRAPRCAKTFRPSAPSSSPIRRTLARSSPTSPLTEERDCHLP